MPRLLSEKTTNWQQFTVALPEKDIDDNGYFESWKKKKKALKISTKNKHTHSWIETDASDDLV